jgi:uncharacterized protein
VGPGLSRQTNVAEYNRISQSLAETPKEHRPRFSRIDERIYDSMDWRTGFLIATEFSQNSGGQSFAVTP